jgi:hypothetical protein
LSRPAAGALKGPARGGATYQLNRDKLRKTRRREGRYLLRTNLTETDPVKPWNYDPQLVSVAETFRTLTGDSRDSPERPPGRDAHRSVPVHRLPRLLPTRDAPAATQITGPRLTTRRALDKVAAV